MVKILLGLEEAYPGMPDNHGLTPLSRAACVEYEGVAKILLGRQVVNPDTPRPKTALLCCPGHEQVVKIQLTPEEFNPENQMIAAECCSRKPLSMNLREWW